MKLTDLKIFLDGASSTLEIYPNSSVRAELERIYALTSKRSRCVSTGMTGRIARAADPQVVTVCLSDRAALEGDWRSIGNDFLNAYERERSKEAKQARALSNEAPCLGY